MTKENENWTSSKNFAPKLNLNHNISNKCLLKKAWAHNIIVSVQAKQRENHHDGLIQGTVWKKGRKLFPYHRM